MIYYLPQSFSNYETLLIYEDGHILRYTYYDDGNYISISNSENTHFEKFSPATIENQRKFIDLMFNIETTRRN